MNSRRIIISFLAVVTLGATAMLGAAAGGTAVYIAARDQLESQRVVTVEVPVVQTATEIERITDTSTAVQAAAAKVSPAVVTVVTDAGSGSGVIFSPDGYLVTNNHVVEGGRTLEVILHDGTTVPAVLVGTDEFEDLAVLKIDTPTPIYAQFGNSDNLNPGETVIAIGSPLGDFRNTVTVGVVSATGRALDLALNFQMQDLVQTDAAINHGNSGGPLVNLAGEIVGINTMVVRGDAADSQAEGLGFAIASNVVKAISGQLVDQGFVSRPYMGIGWESITPDVARTEGLPVEWGIYISSVAENSPAAAAQLRPGDILTQVGGVVLDEQHPFINALWAYNAGETVSVTIVRNGETLTLDVTLAERPHS